MGSSLRVGSRVLVEVSWWEPVGSRLGVESRVIVGVSPRVCPATVRVLFVAWVSPLSWPCSREADRTPSVVECSVGQLIERGVFVVRHVTSAGSSCCLGMDPRSAYSPPRSKVRWFDVMAEQSTGAWWGPGCWLR